MYYTEIPAIDIPFLHDAAMVCREKGHRLRSIYIDYKGRCAMSYYGDIPLIGRAEILQNYLPLDASFEECYQMAQDNQYCRWHYKEGTPNGFTQFYTPDDLDYRTLKQ